MNAKFKTEGLILKTLPFQDFDSIITLFSPTEGLIKLFYKGAYKSKKGNTANAITPLTIVEVIYTKGRSDLYPCQEITALDHLLPLRQNLNLLNTACDLIKIIEQTQQPCEPAEPLYELLLTYLKKLPLAFSPTTIRVSFYLKLLRYEGFLGMISHCSECALFLKDAWIFQGEIFCEKHHPQFSIYLKPDERDLIEILTFSRDFSQLAKLSISDCLTKKISTIPLLAE